MFVYSKFILPGALLLATLAFGLWLSLSGKPYNGILFNVHKLAALASVIMIVINMVQTLKATHVQTSAILLLVLAGICVIALFATGALMSAGAPQFALMLIIHRVTLVLLPLALAAAVYLLALLGGKG